MNTADYAFAYWPTPAGFYECDIFSFQAWEGYSTFCKQGVAL
ncbi:hypothetical protein M899_2026 [Bacteriovorax sp. BSW11_IV]|nr:hypothetical protein M899_2026 [Bacteriovorax sp. BSW11_IV]